VFSSFAQINGKPWYVNTSATRCLFLDSGLLTWVIASGPTPPGASPLYNVANPDGPIVPNWQPVFGPAPAGGFV
jgi:hypothetical protein